jgi:hypothetical protein
MRVAENEVAALAVVRSDKRNALDQAMFDSRLRAAGQLPMTAESGRWRFMEKVRVPARVCTSQASSPLPVVTALVAL